MIRRISTACPSRCGTELYGEVDGETREFIHRFRFPKGVEDLIPSTHTEVDEVRLITFGPDTGRWFLECPLCRTRIPIPAEGT